MAVKTKRNNSKILKIENTKQELIKEEIGENTLEKENKSLPLKIQADVFITLEDFLLGFPELSDPQRYYYKNNFKSVDLRTSGDWLALTGLK